MSSARVLGARTSARSRRGALLVLAALMIVVMLGMVAFALDLGIVMTARTEAQRAADSAALAAAWELALDSQLQGNHTALHDSMRRRANEFANYHTVGNQEPNPQINSENHVDGDIIIGRLNNPSNLSEPMVFNSILGDNAITVRVRMLGARDTSIPLYFGRVFGIGSTDVTAEATAMFNDNVIGFRTNAVHPTSGLLPFALHVDTWQDLMDGLTTADDWAYDSQTGEVTRGSDGIAEVRLYPGGDSQGDRGGPGHIAPGNFGTVDIGNPNNSARDLLRQIQSGPNQADFSHHGGELILDAGSQTLTLNGDTGVTASMFSAMEKIVGDGRTIMLYNQVTGSGNTAMFTVVGFGGVRVLDYQLTGKNKYILMQPSIVIDPTAVSGNYGQSYFVGQPVRLVR
ncbi:MAG: hypothetical protein GTO53_04800 [Planctomycetales bacterium]|nr:hypothetical protein [Planctomycetales bacterium]NIM08473.1 hypothetical protein [Planctomycetales bacterium]NIN07953.1 hypothetical protein [Planctomycetales bacterium]NIN77081.1 hypothetical protein [Planctomycetales bacterium]NIO34259.1 hypothetical protein [Planctomycetales bacterium]